MKPGRILFLSLALAALLGLVWHVQTTIRRGPLNKGLADAVKRGDLSMVQLLLERGADPSTRDATGVELASWALVADQLPTAEVLLKRGAQIDRRFCLLDAMAKSNGVVVGLLLKHGANP